MNIEEFEAEREELACRHCGHKGLDHYFPRNGNHHGAMCPGCGSVSPLAQQWLSQNGSSEHVRRIKHNADEIWNKYGNHCSFCGKSRELCELLKISRQAQHIHPIMFGGKENGSVIPICARCQEMTRPLLLETRDILRALTEVRHLRSNIFG